MRRILTFIVYAILLITGELAFAQGPYHPPVPFPQERSISQYKFDLGAVFGDLDDATKAKYKITEGALTKKVNQDGPAEKAGLIANDIVLEFDNHKVRDSRMLHGVLSTLNEPKEVSLKILRDGKVHTLSMIPDKKEVRAATNLEKREVSSVNYIGAKLVELDASLATYFKVAPHSGVLITEVAEGGPAQKAGIQSGDIVQAVNSERVQSSDELRRTILKSGESAKIEVVRHEKRVTFDLELEKRDTISGGANESNPLGAAQMDKNREKIQELRRQIQEKYRNELEQIRQEMNDGLDQEEAERRLQEIRNKMDTELQMELQKLQQRGVNEKESQEKQMHE